jgi:hypothetical protein
MELGHPKQGGGNLGNVNVSGGGVSSGGGGGGAAVAMSNGVNELSQLALWMAATLAGLVTAAMTARTPFFRGVMQRLGVSPGAAALRGPASLRKLRPGRDQSLPMLGEAIVGSSKSAIASVFGPPRSAVVMAAAAGATFWQADTWYYPLPKSGPLAMAIVFDGDDARRVEFLRAPEV